MAFGCAGTTPIITKFADEIEGVLAGGGDHTRKDLENTLEGHVKHLQQSYPNELLSLVAALWTEEPIQEKRVYKIFDNSHCLSVQPEFACAGMDSSLAYAALRSIHDPYLMPVDEGIRLAVFTTGLMKEFANSVGGPTRVYFYRTGARKWEYLTLEKAKQIEGDYPIEGIHSLLREYWSRKK